MHPFYGPNRRLLHREDTRREGLISMAAHLLFWAAAVPLAMRGLKRFVAQAPAGVPAETRDDRRDPAIAVLRLRLARGEIDVEEYLTRYDVLRRR